MLMPAYGAVQHARHTAGGFDEHLDLLTRLFTHLQAGIAFRGNTSPGSPSIAISSTGGNGAEAGTRLAQGGATGFTGQPAASKTNRPIWLKIAKNGNTFAA